MKFLSDILAKAGLTVDGVVTLNNTATGQTPNANDNSTKLATTAWVRTFVQPYSLPIATSSVLGGIKVGTGLSIDAGTGILSVSGGGAASIKSTQTFTATAGQTVFTISGGYIVGLIDVFLNGVYLSPNQTTATNGTTVTLGDAALAGDIIDVIIASPVYQGATTTTDQLPEGSTNLYFTNARARAAISESVTGLDYNSATGVLSITTGYGIPTTASQTTWDAAYNDKINSAAVTGTTTKTLTLTQQDGGTITASWTDDNTDAVTSVFGRTGAVVATSGDYTTALVTEVTNLYYTDARARAAISVTGSGSYDSATGIITVTGGVTSVNTLTGAVTLTTTNIGEGTNLYYTTARANSDFDTRLGTKSTTNLAEGTNLYYTTARANSDFDTRLATKSTTNLAEGTNLYYTDTRVGTYLTGNSYATQSYVSTQINNLVSGAPGLLDTLDELAAALGDDPNFATTVSTALGNRLRIDIGTQGLTGTQQGYGRTNLGLGSLSTLSSVANAQITDVAWSKVTGVPSTFAPSAHTHPISDITGLQTALDGKQASLSGTGFVKISGSTISYDNSTYYLASNPSGYITGISFANVSAKPTTLSGYGITDGTKWTSGRTTADLNTLGLSNASSGIYSLSNNANAPASSLYGTLYAFWNEDISTQLYVSYNGSMYWRPSVGSAYTGASWRTVWDSTNLTNLNQLTNGPGYITGITSSNVTTALGYTPYNSTNPSGYITSSSLTSYVPIAGGVNMTGKLGIMNGSNGAGDKGIAMWQVSDTNWGIYMTQAGAGLSFSNGTAVSSIDGRTSHHIRFRVNNSSTNGFIWENASESALMSLTADTGNIYVKGQVITTSASSRFGNLLVGQGTYKNSIQPVDDVNMNLSTPSGAVYVSNTLYINGSTAWHAGNLTNLSQLTNGPGYITSYTETDTLATVTGRGASTSTNVIFSGNITNTGTLFMKDSGPSIYENRINAGWNSTGDAVDLWINYEGYQNSTAHFRDFRIGDGKRGAAIVFVDGSDRVVNVAANIDFAQNYVLRVQNPSMMITALAPSYFGYSSGYGVLIVGQTGANNRTLSFGVDVSGNPSGAFTGHGNEYLWRNAASFITPNASNNGYNTLLSWNSSGQITFASSITTTGATIGRVIMDYDGTDSWFRMQSGNRMRITTTGGTDFIIPNTGNMTYNGNTVWHSGNLTNLNQLSNGPGYITSSALSSYLPLSGGTMSGQLYAPSIGTGVYEGAIQIRETSYVGSNQSAWGYAPAITFHWGNRTVKKFGIRADGLFAVDDEPLALRSWVTSQGYITSYSETDTLSSVTGRGNTTGSNIITSTGMYANIFYDYYDNGYYFQGRGISRMYGVAIRGDNSSTSSENQIFFWGAGNTTTSAIGFKANGGSFGNPTGFGDGYNTYLTMDTDGRGWVFRRGVGGTDFSSAYTAGWILNNGIWQANSQMRSPVFKFTNSSNNAYLTGNSDWGFRAVNDNGYIQFGPANGSWSHIYSDKSFYFNQQLYINGTQVVSNSGTWSINVTGTAASETLSTVTGRGATTGSFVSMTGGSRIIVQNSSNGGTERGLYMWNTSDPNWVIYMATGGVTSPAGNTTCNALDGATSHAIRFRIAGTSNSFIWENTSEQCLMSLNGADNSTGGLFVKRRIRSSGGFNLSGDIGFYTSYTSDGLFSGSATPNTLSTTSNGGNLTLGYQDNGSGLYSPAYGFDVRSTDGRPVGGQVVKAIVMRDLNTGAQPFIVYNNGYIFTSTGIQSSGSVKVTSNSNDASGFTNSDLGNSFYTDRGGRLLTSNGTNWASDGRDPALVISGSYSNTDRGRIGLALHNEITSNNAFAPMIAFSSKSQSGGYNTVYASIMGRYTGYSAGLDTNWAKGELHFYAHGDTYVDDTPTMKLTGAGFLQVASGGGSSTATFSLLQTGYSNAYFQYNTGKLQIGGDSGLSDGIYFNMYNGSSYGDRFVIKPNGRVNIISGGRTLSLGDGNYSNHILVDSNVDFAFNYNNGSTGGFGFFGGTSSAKFMCSYTGTLTVSGDVVAYGSPSDARLKDIKEKVPNALDSILKLNGYRFDWKEKELDIYGDDKKILHIKEDIGVIAQEVADVLPELAKTNEDGFMSVRYQGLTAVLIEAIKEQQTQIESQKSEIDELKDLVQQLINR